jgi:Carboxypeptidase regulatory-like domain
MKSLSASVQTSVARLLLLCCSVTAVASIAVSLPAALYAQAPAQRVVQGRVEDKAGNGVKAAIVYLKNTQTLSVKTFIADDAGSYRFGQLAQNTDFEIWAESNGKKSGTKSISSFDTKNEFNFILKIDTGK